MKRIASFKVDHNKLEPGLYISRVDGDVISYDVRFLKPNNGTYLDYDGIHTLEHLLATYIRNTKYANDIVYVGPMGCRTGFYILTRDHVTKTEFISLLKDTIKFVKDYEGEIPGVSAIECGNYLEHNLEKAKVYAKDYDRVLQNWTEQKLNY